MILYLHKYSYFMDRNKHLKTLIKKYNLQENNDVCEIYNEFYDKIIGKEIMLSDIYDKLTLKYLQVEPLIGEKNQFDKKYFLNNKFIFKRYTEEPNIQRYDFYKKLDAKTLKFQIILFHMFESNSIVRYQIIYE